MSADPPNEDPAREPDREASSPPPGWYADPTRPGRTRWWDGARWGALDVPEDRKTNGLSIAALILGVLWLYWIGSVLALLLGDVARGQIRRSNGAQGGDGMATAGIVLGWIGLAVLLLLIVLLDNPVSGLE
jgi:hypothetical protein